MKKLSVRTAVKLTLTVLAFYAVVVVLAWSGNGPGTPGRVRDDGAPGGRYAAPIGRQEPGETGNSRRQ